MNNYKNQNITEIVMNFSKDLIEKVDGLVKMIILFGSYARNENNEKSDIDLLIIVDDVNPDYKNTMVSFYYDNLNKILSSKEEYKKLHVTTITLSIFYDGILKGDPLILNILRIGEPIIDPAGFFSAFKELLKAGKIKHTEESILELKNKYKIENDYIYLNLFKTLESIYLSALYLSQYILIRNKIEEIEPEKIYSSLKRLFKNKKIDQKYAEVFKELYKYVKESSKDIKLLKFDKVIELYNKYKELEKILLKLDINSKK